MCVGEREWADGVRVQGTDATAPRGSEVDVTFQELWSAALGGGESPLLTAQGPALAGGRHGDVRGCWWPPGGSGHAESEAGHACAIGAMDSVCCCRRQGSLLERQMRLVERQLYLVERQMCLQRRPMRLAMWTG